MRFIRVAEANEVRFEMASHFSGKAGERVKLSFIQWPTFENGIRLFISDDFINLAGI